jgi:hypothetical protein
MAMSAVVRKLAEDRETSFDTGTVVAQDGETFCVRLSAGEIWTRRAKSCLVEPEVGDDVIVADGARGRWVLAVLHGGENAVSRIVARGGLEIHSPEGQISIAAGNRIDLTAPEGVAVTSSRFDLRAIEATAVFKRMTLVGASVLANLENVKSIARAVDTVVDRLTQKAQRVYRFVEEFDQLRAEQIDYRARKVACLRGENTVMTAQECVKIDGEQVHIG